MTTATAPKLKLVSPPKLSRSTIKTEVVACCVCGNAANTVVGTGVDFEYDTCDNVWTYVKCNDCSHHYLSPRPIPDELGTIYPANYGNYSNSVKPGLAFRVKAFLESFTLKKLADRLPENGVVLDVGCGDGRLLDGIKNASRKPLQFEGVEISDMACQAAIEKGYKVHMGSIDTLELPESRYDLICLIQVIEHVFEPVECLKKLERILKPGGIAIIETPSVKCLDYSLFKKRYWGGYHLPRHFNLFEPKTLSSVAEQAGLEVESVKHKLQPVHWVWSAHHWFKEHNFPKFWTESFHIRNPFWLGCATILDAMQLMLFRTTSNQQLIARKPLFE